MIKIFGDSFATSNGKNGWPDQVGKLLNTDIINYARAGTSTWWSYQKFLQNYKKFDKIIFTYSSYSRWQTLTEPHEYMSAVIQHHDVNFVADEVKDVAKILASAHPILYSDEFNKFVYQSIFNSVNNICRENSISLINVMSFEEYPNDLPISLDNRYGACVTGLNRVSILEASTNSRLGKFLQTNDDIRICHLNSNNNRATAEIVSQLFSASTDIINVTNSPEYDYTVDDIDWSSLEN